MVKKVTNETLLKFVCFSLIMVIIYAVIAIIFQFITHEELSPTLTTCFMAVFGGEVLAAALIKIFKLRKE